MMKNYILPKTNILGILLEKEEKINTCFSDGVLM